MRFLVLGLVLVSTSSALVAQAPPVKLGLWEKSIVTSGTKGIPSTEKAKACVTADSWKLMFNMPSKEHLDCSVNAVKTAKGYTFIASCSKGPGTYIITQGRASIPDSEHIVTESHTQTTIHGKTTQVDSQSTSHYVEDSCGETKPTDPQIEQ